MSVRVDESLSNTIELRKEQKTKVTTIESNKRKTTRFSYLYIGHLYVCLAYV